MHDELDRMQMLGVADCSSAVRRIGLDADAWCGRSFFWVLTWFFKRSTVLGFFMAIGSGGGLLTRSSPLALGVSIATYSPLTVATRCFPIFCINPFLIRVFPSAVAM